MSVIKKCSSCPFRGIPVIGRNALKNSEVKSIKRLDRLSFLDNYKKCKLLILGDAPDKYEDRIGAAFTGDSSNVIDEVIDELTSLGYSTNEIWIDNVCCCRSPGNRKPTFEQVENCRERTDALIKAVDPDVIVPLGNAALFYLENRRGGIISRAGIPKKIGKRWSIPCLHPSFFSRRGNIGTEIIFDHIKIAATFAFGSEEINHSYTIINNMELLLDWLEMLEDDKISRMSFDVESRNVEINSELLGIGFSHRVGAGIYIPLQTSMGLARRVRTSKKGKAKKAVKTTLSPFWGGSQGMIVSLTSWLLTSGKFNFGTHNGGFDLRKMKYESMRIHKGSLGELKYEGWDGKDLRFSPDLLDRGFETFDFGSSWVMDSQYADYFLNENKELQDRKLGLLAARYPDLAGFKDATEGTKDFSTLPLSLLGDRCAKDCDATFRLCNDYAEKIVDEGLEDLFWDHHLPTQQFLTDMELTGIYPNLSHVENIGSKLTKELKSLDNKLVKMSKVSTYNPGSSEQTADIIFNKLKVGDPVIFTDNKNKPRPSTKEDHLSMFSDHPFVETYLKRVHKAKRLSTYVIGYKELINQETGRIHTNYLSSFVVTGRLASRKPNLQSAERSKEVRNIFSSPPGYALVYFDFSQVEIMWLTYLSRDPGLMEAFNSGKDVHSFNVSLCFPEYTYNDVQKALLNNDNEMKNRRTGVKKGLSFGKIYGMAAESLAVEIQLKGESFDSALKRAKNLIRISDEAFPRVNDYSKEVYEKAREDGCIVYSPYGRKRRLPELLSSDEQIRSRNERQALNFTCQEPASTMTMKYGRLIWDEIKSKILLKLEDYTSFSSPVRPYLTIHDSLFFLTRYDLILKVIKVINDTINLVLPLEGFDLPVRYDLEIFKHWESPLKIHLKGKNGKALCGHSVSDDEWLIENIDERIPEQNWCSACLEEL